MVNRLEFIRHNVEVTAMLNLEEVFVTEGVPEFTFVQPPNYNEILLDVRRPGKPVILEGQSGTGKTTCIRRILAQLGAETATEYLGARSAVDVSRIQKIADTGEAGRFVIDDFHRLTDDLQRRLADIAKLAAEQGQEGTLPKLIIIGINQVGSDLIQLVPDIAKRTGVHRIKPGDKNEIESLVLAGCDKLNIKFSSVGNIYEETRGDYWLTQQICQSICTANGVTQTSDKFREISFDMSAIRLRVVEKLNASYYPAVKEFCRGRRFRPSNDPYFKLLRSVGQNASSIVDLNELANSNDAVRGSINNIKEHRLRVLIESKALVQRHFYYNNETKNFAIEDPALFYFLKHLDWNQLRQDCGFRDEAASFEYDVALSFAGENRELARHIFDGLEMLDVHVFFDEMFEANFLGKTWANQFEAIFSTRSRFVLCILDRNHRDKIWPTFERQHFAPRVHEETVIPIFLDDTAFVGIPEDLVGIKFNFNPSEDSGWKKRADDEIVLKIIDKLSQ
jgi:hypothetical protein